MVRDSTNITIAIKYEVMHSPSNDAIANVVPLDLDLHFLRSKFEMLISGKR